MKSLVSTVFAVSDSIHDNRTPYSVLASLVSEVGELADEIVIQEGHSHKEVGEDGILGESIDSILCALDMIRITHPDITEEQLVEVATRKCLKWSRSAQLKTQKFGAPKRMVYLSAPYTDSDPAVVAQRMKIVRQVDAYLTKQGIHTISPLFKHETVTQHAVPSTWEYWEQYSYQLLLQCTDMVIIPLAGVNVSAGVLGEMMFCDANHIPYSQFDMRLLQENPSIR